MSNVTIRTVPTSGRVSGKNFRHGTVFRHGTNNGNPMWAIRIDYPTEDGWFMAVHLDSGRYAKCREDEMYEIAERVEVTVHFQGAKS